MGSDIDSDEPRRVIDIAVFSPTGISPAGALAAKEAADNAMRVINGAIADAVSAEREACLDLLAKEYHAALTAGETMAGARLGRTLLLIAARRPK